MRKQLALLLALSLVTLMVSPAALAEGLPPAAPAGSPAVETAGFSSAIQAAMRGVPLAPKLALPDQGQAQSGQQQQPSEKQWTRGGKIMTIIGLGAAGAGAAMIFAAPERSYVGDEGLYVNWRATGAIWLSAGGVLALIGLTRRK